MSRASSFTWRPRRRARSPAHAWTSLADFVETAPESDRSLSEALRRLPMFPLPNVVLFPHALLPLHVFEERYRALARDVLAGHHFLAVTLLSRPEDADLHDRPPVERVAGVGEVVMAHELPDGRFNLVVRARVSASTRSWRRIGRTA